MPVSPRVAHAVFLATMAGFEARFRRRMVAEKDRFILACAGRYAEHGTPNFFDLVGKHREAIFGMLASHYRQVIPAFGALSLAQVRSRSLKDTEEDSLFSKLADYWVHTQGLKRSHLIADTSEADVLAAISSGLEDGEGTAEIARGIREVADLSPFRSELIARTETHAAANYAGIESVRDAQQKLGVTMLKQWLPTLDERTRPDHAAMNGSDPIAMDEKFLVGGEEMDRPGDPTASADQVINCRCTLVYSEAKSN